jgi:hypothetical protein
METEADICRGLITPKLQAAGLDAALHSGAEQRSFANDRISDQHQIDALQSEADAQKRLPVESHFRLQRLLPSIPE